MEDFAMNRIIAAAFITVALLSSALFAGNNAAYLDIGGPAGYYALTFDHRFIKKGPAKIGGQLSISVAETNARYTTFIIPVTGYLLFGGRHNLEAAVSVVPLIPDGNDVTLGVSPIVGYRFQPPNVGFSFRLFGTLTKVNVLDNGDRVFYFWPGASLGFTF
jgi:hypothetical protein